MELPQGTALQAALKDIQAAVKQARGLEMPVGGEFHYHNNFAAFSSARKEVEARIRAVLGGLPGVSKAKAASFDVRDDAADDWMEEVMDGLLDQLGIYLDRHKRGEPTSGLKYGAELKSLGGTATIAKKGKGVFTPAGSQGLPRPQDTFSIKVDNSSVPFEHYSFDQTQAVAPPSSSSAHRRLEAYARSLNTPHALQMHPLQDALDRLQYMNWQLVADEPVAAGPLEETPFKLVETPEGLDALCSSLAGAREIAVDLENHSYRSFQGFTCLMQLSTREGDWVVDTLSLRDLIGPKLGPFFADPGVEKVLHGADHDVTWLQRDFRIYIVNLFDTGQAARVLEFPSFGLAYLMNHYCGVKLDKRYQLADWRLRPLSDEMLHYARMDTHNLLYIRDRLRAELKAKSSVPQELLLPVRPASNAGGDALGTVLERSRKICLKLYEKELFSETSYLDDCKRSTGVSFDKEQMAVYAALYAWRDALARTADESPGYVLPRSALNCLVRSQPSSRRELVAALKSTPPLVEAHADAVVKLIADAKQQVGVEKEMKPTGTEAAEEQCPVVPKLCKKVPTGMAALVGGHVKPKPAGPPMASTSVPSPSLPTASAPAGIYNVPNIVKKKASGGLAGMLSSNKKSRAADGLAPQHASDQFQDGDMNAAERLPMDKTGELPDASPSGDGSSGKSDVGKDHVARGDEGGGAVKRMVKLSRGAGSVLGRALGGGVRSESTAAVLAKVQASITLPFSLVAQVGGQSDTAGAQSNVVEEESNDGDQGTGTPATDDKGNSTPAAEQEQTVSEWLDEQRGARNGSNAKEGDERDEKRARTEEKPAKQAFEEYLPLSLSERYSKRHKGPSAGLSSQDHLKMEMAAKKRARNAGSSEVGRGEAGGVVPFDYGASAAQNPSISAAFKPQLAGSKWRQQVGGGRRGRGRGSVGGGRTSVNNKAVAAAPVERKMRPAAHEMAAGDLLKVGKRSAAFPRSGNRSGTFK